MVSRNTICQQSDHGSFQIRRATLKAAAMPGHPIMWVPSTDPAGDHGMHKAQAANVAGELMLVIESVELAPVQQAALSTTDVLDVPYPAGTTAPYVHARVGERFQVRLLHGAGNITIGGTPLAYDGAGNFKVGVATNVAVCVATEAVDNTAGAAPVWIEVAAIHPITL